MNTKTKPNKSFLIIGILALLWNIMGLFQFIMAAFMQDTMLETYSETYTDQQMELFLNTPSWYYVVFGICTITGVLGSIAVLLKKKIAVPLFLVSLVTVLVVQGYWMLGTLAIALLGTEAIIMPMLVIVTSIFLYFYCKGARQNNWLS
jgi:predicted MFS family arabinose efflux permease|tara:strand:+ start:151 stop:594 length:444 start_codon:yes stop_codon:yes gene_type:complete